MVDPVYLAWREGHPELRAEDWILQHGDRRKREFRAAHADYAQRRLTAQVSVAEQQVQLARKLGLPLIVQLPPQDEAERRMAEVLLAGLGGEGSEHRILLSSFRGRPKCASMMLKAFPSLMLGFSGLLTHKKMKDVLGEIAFDTPLDRFVLESLGPLFPPSASSGGGGGTGAGDLGMRGSFSHPLHVLEVAAALAKIKANLSPDEIMEAAWKNANMLFQLRISSAVTST
eukprot:gnl/TRDRNA2_/TRDRNA2_172676_c2_seq2.p1 gnl/TRDRNA2_/TRDRNA2_172676_c2~~gnl/TRDRNA2_/TRDRNA2_172676_c2_seq2.p1  ORF type:complete len:229 (+),score=48.79 gnl/TRDRNA2_/TRDRNA2_172676_c2_seq2:162-848(+)